MKKIIIALMIATTTFLSSGIVFADDPTTEETPATEETTTTPPRGIEDATFSVTEYLKLDDGGQEMGYFEDGEHSPIVALILSVIEFATIVIGSIAVILLIIAGFRFMFAQGNDQSLTEAKDMVKYTVIGLIIAFLSYTIVTFIQSVFI